MIEGIRQVPIRERESEVMKSAVNVAQVTKSYGDFIAVDSIDLNVREGEFLTLLGPSGSGKSTTLQMIAGFEEPTSGEILIHGKVTKGVPPHRRNIGMVFQGYSLFPHMSVFENVAFPLRIRRIRTQEIQRRVREVLEVVNLHDFSHRRPRELSGGQRQRVALARAFVYEPELLLMDEPLSALDKNLREQLQNELRRIHKQLGVTIVFVTHDQEEALRLSDRIAVFENGKIAQCATGVELYNRPSDEFVAAFLGSGNFFNGIVKKLDTKAVVVELNNGNSVIAAHSNNCHCQVGDFVKVFVRPENMSIGKQTDSSDGQLRANRIKARITERVFVGGAYHTYVRTDADELVEIKGSSGGESSAGDAEVGDVAFVRWSSAETSVFPG